MGKPKRAVRLIVSATKRRPVSNCSGCGAALGQNGDNHRCKKRNKKVKK